MAPPAAVSQSAVVTFRVLEAVAALQPVGVSDLARHLGLAKSTVHRALRTLEHLDYVGSTGPVTRWALTLRAYHVGSKAAALSLRDLALSEMERISRATDEAVHLTARQGRFVVVLEKLDGQQAIRAYTEKGAYLPAHASATGKAILACSPPDAVQEVLDGGMERHTATTVVDPEAFVRALAEVRAQGYAVNDGERRSDVAAVGVAILDGDDRAVGGLGVSAPIGRMPPERLQAIAALLQEAAARVSRQLGR